MLYPCKKCKNLVAIEVEACPKCGTQNFAKSCEKEEKRIVQKMSEINNRISQYAVEVGELQNGLMSEILNKKRIHEYSRLTNEANTELNILSKKLIEVRNKKYQI